MGVRLLGKRSVKNHAKRLKKNNGRSVRCLYSKDAWIHWSASAPCWGGRGKSQKKNRKGPKKRGQKIKKRMSFQGRKNQKEV